MRYFGIFDGYFRQHIATIFEHIGDLCTIFISLDEVIDSNDNLRDGLNAYKDMMKTIAQDPQRFDTDATTLDHFDEYINTLEVRQDRSLPDVFSRRPAC